MKNTPRPLVFSLLFASLCLFSACTKSGGSKDSSGGGGNNPDPNAPGARTECGVVVNGKIKNPVLESDGEPVRVVQVISNNILVVSSLAGAGGPNTLIKLQGVGASLTTFKSNAAINRIKSLTSGGAYFFKATKDCNISVPGSGTGTVGSLLTLNGASIGEDLILSDLAPAESNDACNGNLIGSCLLALEESKVPATAGGVGPNFLWKPQADKDGRLVIHVNACNVDIFVNGERLSDAGPGNGRCSTGRGTKPGCGYGRATVTVVDRESGLPLSFETGQTSLIIPSGCQRFEADYPFE